MTSSLILAISFFLFASPSWSQEEAAGWYLKQCKRIEKDVKSMMKKARSCKSDSECFLTNEVSDKYACCQFDVISRKAKVDRIKKKIIEMENLNCPAPKDCPCEDWSKSNYEVFCKKKTCQIRHQTRKNKK